MKVTLLRYTPDALDLLLGTKSTRMRGKDPALMSDDERRYHWQYMLDTIRSPFEFVDYVFQIEGVSKNFTHQFVRTRTGAYQQETSRALDMSESGTICPENLTDEQQALFWDGVADANANYQQLLAAGVQLQDARAILPSNMETKITAKFNLRTLSDTAKTRLCARTQGEYQHVFRAMREAVLDVHPWADSLLQVHCVATGTCAFPRWGSEKILGKPQKTKDGGRFAEIEYQCPHYDPRMDLSKVKEETRIKFWSKNEIAQANPVAKDGVSM